jgi:autotransporter-associated beta strand protein
MRQASFVILFCLLSIGLSGTAWAQANYLVTNTSGDTTTAGDLGHTLLFVAADGPSANDNISFSPVAFNTNETITLTASYPAITLNSSGSLTIGGSLYPLTLDGGGTNQILNVTGGTLSLSNLTLQNGTASLSNVILTVPTGNQATINVPISGTGGLSVAGSGTMIFGSANTYSGGTSLVSNGTLSISSDSALGNSTGGLTFQGGTLQTSGIFSSARNIQIGTGGGTIGSTGSVMLTGTISDTGGSPGTLTLSGGQFTLANPSQTNTYSGGTSIYNSTVNVDKDGEFGNSAGTLMLNNSTLNLGASFNTSSRLIYLETGGGTFNLTSANQSVTLSGFILDDTGSLGSLNLTSSTHSGTFYLTNTLNGYGGGTSVGTGVTLVSSTGSDLGVSSSTLLLSGGTLETSGSIGSRLIILQGTGTIDLVGGINIGISGDIQEFGTGTLNVVGSGTLRMSTDGFGSTYSGGTVVNSGVTVDIDLATALGTGAVTMNGGTLQTTSSLNLSQAVNLTTGGGGTFDVGSGQTTTLSGGFGSGSGTLTLLGGGTLSLTGSTLYTGNTVINAGTLNLAPTANVIYAGNITGAGSLSVGGTNTLTLSGSNSYSGGTNITSGTIALGANNALVTGTALSDSGTLDLNGFNQSLSSITGSGVITNSSGTAGTLTMNNSGTDSFAGSLTGNLALYVSSTGTLNLSGNNSYTGPTTLFSGNLNALSNNALGTGIVNLDGGTFNGGVNTTLSNIINVGAPNIFILGNSGLNLSGEIALGNNNLIFGATQSGGGQVVSGATTFSGEIFGGGSLQMEANTTATLVLTSNNGIGSIQMYGGTLQVGYATALGTAAITIGNGATLQSGVSGLDLFNSMDLTGSANYDTNGFNTTLEDPIVGPSGSLTKLGSGTLTLAYTNTYGGGTTVMAGTLNLGSNSALGTGGLVLENGTTLQAGTGSLVTANAVTLYGSDTYDANGFDSTLSGNITGTGGFMVTDSSLSGGILTLTGMNTYSGATTVENSAILSLQSGQNIGSNGLFLNGGTLQANAGGTGLSLSQAVTLGSNGGTFDANGLNSTLAGVISGSGGFTVTDSAGGGVLTLTRQNTYSGGTLVNAVVLNLGNSLALGTGDVTFNGGTLQSGLSGLAINNNLQLSGNGTFDDNGKSSTLLGVIAGTGSLTMIDTEVGGTLTLTGANTYSGGTLISGGTLVGNTTSLQGNITDNSALVFNQASNGAYAGIISGSGTLSLIGGNALTLTGANTNTGGININSGTLVAANSGALGHGNVAVNAGGTLAINGPLAINITGTYTQAPGGTLQLGLGGATAGLYDSLNITGAATLGGTLKLVPYGGYQLHDTDTFTLLTASSITGNFSAVTDGLGGDAVSLVYGLGSVTADAVVVSLAPSAPSFTALGQTSNQKSAGAALDNIATNTPNNSLITYLNTLSNSALPGVENQMSPSNLTPMFQMNFATAELEAQMIGQRLSQMLGNARFSSDWAYANGPMFAGNMPADQEAQIAQSVQPERWGAFANGMGNFGTVTSDGNGAGYQFSTGGTTAGLDYRFAKDLVAGLMIGYDQSGTSQSTGTVNVSGGQLGLYAGWKADALHIDALVDGGLDSYTTVRTGLGGNANGNTSGTEYTGQLNIGYDLKFEDYQISPYVSGQLTQVNVNGFTETGSLSPLTYANQGEQHVSSDLGAQVSRSWTVSGIKLSPNVSASWEHIYQGNADALTASFGTGNNFTVAGSVTGTDDAVLGAGLNAEFAKGLNVYANYQGKVGLTNYTDQAISGGVNLGF